MARIFNFGAGPAAIPLEVLEQAKDELLDFNGTGMSIMETSHRAASFDAVIKSAQAGVKNLLGLNDEYEILLLQGGASTQFCMIPMNLLNGGTADYVDTGSWSSKAIKEGKLFGTVNVAYDGKEASNYTKIPKLEDLKLTDGAEYVHITSNNTIAGTEFFDFPKVDAPLIADMSSDIFSRPFDATQFDMIYAGAQKNAGPSGLTIVAIKKSLAEKVDKSKVPSMLRYSEHIDKDSLLNTPPTFAIYLLDLVCKWVESKGGAAGIEKVNIEKADKLYAAINGSNGYYSCPVAEDSRSRMNVVFRLPSEDLEKKFVADAAEKGMAGLKGHRSVGGIRASIYNATGIEAIDALTAFMKDFSSANG
ncbi:MAG: 3-phosphoserine/phosphohydroxythreonine transaminase [Planctomycetota bacterium]|jgi:phosphoserine aminotransferase